MKFELPPIFGIDLLLEFILGPAETSFSVSGQNPFRSVDLWFVNTRQLLKIFLQLIYMVLQYLFGSLALLSESHPEQLPVRWHCLLVRSMADMTSLGRSEYY